MTESSPIAPLRVVVVGGGIAALETVLALHELAEAQLRVTLIAPEPDFILRPLAVATPFSRGHANRLPLAQVMAEHSGRFIRSAVLRIDAEARTVTLTTGDDVAYDVLVLALGASAVPAFTHAVTFGAHPEVLNGILADLEQGWSRSVAFVVPRGCSWPLPIYELALMTAEAVWSMNMDDVDMHLVTPEREPLEIFGTEASAAVAQLLAGARITVHHGAFAQVHPGGRIETGSGSEIAVDCVVALPVLEGPKLDGVPSSAQGFIPVDDVGLVAGLDSVYAVGDATDRPIKQGGLACQQADVTAAHIAATAGAGVEVPPLEQVLRGRLLTGTRDRFLRRDPGEVAGAATAEPLWWPPEKVSGTYLSPYLVAKDVVHLSSRGGHAGPGIDVHVPLTRQQKRVHEDILGLSPLGPIVHC
jgi:sulfide:quinone oxidoreductase